MSPSRSTFAVYALSFLLLVHFVIGADPLFSSCSNSGNFTSYSPYEQNLNQLLGELYLTTPKTGFGKATIGQTFGLSLCRGDVSSKDCMACVTDASIEILKRCPGNKGATIWYDSCLIKYSDSNFFGQIDNGVKFYLWNPNNISYAESFNLKTKRLLGGLSEIASYDSEMYASGAIDLEGSQKLYGMVQCTRDLSSTDCKTCLDSAVSDLPNCCNGKEGARVVSASCNIRYEIASFLRA